MNWTDGVISQQVSACIDRLPFFFDNTVRYTALNLYYDNVFWLHGGIIKWSHRPVCPSVCSSAVHNDQIHKSSPERKFIEPSNLKIVLPFLNVTDSPFSGRKVKRWGRFGSLNYRMYVRAHSYCWWRLNDTILMTRLTKCTLGEYLRVYCLVRF